MEKNKCPKCGINLSWSDRIKIRDDNILTLKLMFGERSLDKNILELGYCDLCGASKKEIIADTF